MDDRQIAEIEISILRSKVRVLRLKNQGYVIGDWHESDRVQYDNYIRAIGNYEGTLGETMHESVLWEF